MPILGNGWRGQRPTAKLQSRNAVSALGQVESFATYVGTWFAGIAIGVALVLLIVLPMALGNDRPTPASQATSDRNGTNFIGNRPIADREQVAKEGYAVFQRAGCEGCHQQGGLGIKGQGPRLAYSGNARDTQYVHSIVRWGYSPMPAYSKQLISDEDLYKITAYIHYLQDNRQNPPAWISK